MSRFAPLLLAISTIACGFPQDSSVGDPEREKDVYAIYSLMLTHPQTSHGQDGNQRHLIEAVTVPGQPKDPCVLPPRQRRSDFAGVLSDFERRKSTPRELRRQFTIPKPYELLSVNEFDEFVKERSIQRANKQMIPNPRFQGVTDVFRLGNVYFNPRGTLALSFISTFCGGLCGLFQWKVFEKSNAGVWEERPWVSCAGMAKNDKSPLLTEGEQKANMDLCLRLLASLDSPPPVLL